MEQDMKDITGPAPNLLLIHYYILQLENFKNESMSRSGYSGGDVQITLKKYFQKVDTLAEEFEAYLWMIARKSLELVKKGQTSTLVRLLKIIETEERADLASNTESKNTDIKGNLSTQTENNHHLGVVSPTSASYDMNSMRSIKSYWSRYRIALQDEILRTFTKLYDENSSDLNKLLAATDLIIEDFAIIHDDLVPAFPVKYGIFNVFVVEYHRNIYDMLNKVTMTPLETSQILKLLKWIEDYYSCMSTRFDVNEDLLEPKLLDGKEDRLIDDYMKLIHTKLHDWLVNLMHTESQEFQERSRAPDLDQNGYYCTSSAVIMFQMVNQQVDIVAGNSSGRLMGDVITECSDILQEYQRSWIKLIEQEFNKIFPKNADKKVDPVEGLLEYCIAVGNDSYRCIDFTEAIIKRVDGLLETSLRGPAKATLTTALDGFVKLSKKCWTVIVDGIVVDIKPALDLLHTTVWYENELMKLIVGTLDDYLTDFQPRMQDYFFTKFITDLIEKFLLLYIQSLRNKSAKFRMSPISCASKMRGDLELVIEFFSRYKSRKRIIGIFDPFEKLIVLIGSSSQDTSLIYADFYTIWSSYGDVPLNFIEELLSKRDDLERSQVKAIMEDCRRKAKEEKPSTAIASSVFSKLT